VLGFQKGFHSIIITLVIATIITIPIPVNAQNQTNNIDTILAKAIRLFQEGNTIDAYIELEAVLKLEPDHPQALQYKAQCEINLGGGTGSEPIPATTNDNTQLKTPTSGQPQATLEVTATTEPTITPIVSHQPTPTPTPSPESVLTSTIPTAPTSTSTPNLAPDVSPTLSPTTNQHLMIADPRGWVKQLPGDPSQIAYYQLPNQQRIVIAEYIVFQEPLSSAKTPEEYLKYLQESRLKPPEFQLYVPVQTESTTMAGLPALRHDFLFSNGTIQLKARVILVILDNLAYSFLFYSNIVDFDRLQADFTQALNSVTLQEKAEDQSLSGISYQDPEGQVRFPLPIGSTAKQTLSNGATYSGPNSSEITILILSSENELKKAENDYTSSKTFQKQSNLDSGQQKIEIKLYSYTENNTNYALLTVNYIYRPVLLIISLPQNQYQPAQPWLIQLIRGAQFN